MNIKIESALAWLDSHDRDIWVKAAMAIKSELGESGFHLWDEWSQTAGNYNSAAARAVWKGVKAGGQVGIGSLFYAAKLNGWQYQGEQDTHSLLELAQRNAKRRIDAMREQAEVESRQQHAAIKARRLWAESKPADANHPYLVRKQVRPYGLRQLNSALLIPLSVDRQLVNIQFIQPDGSKRFLIGGKTKGAYCAISGNTQSMYLCEGWATGATIHQLTGNAVICALSAGNLLGAGLAVRQSTPLAKLIVAADNDRDKVNNTGLIAARQAAERLGAHIVMPEFAADEVGTDFNDRYLLDIAKEAAHVC